MIETDLISELQLSKELGFTRRELLRLVHSGEGPPRILLGNGPYYSKAAVREWLQSKATAKSPFIGQDKK